MCGRHGRQTDPTNAHHVHVDSRLDVHCNYPDSLPKDYVGGLDDVTRGSVHADSALMKIFIRHTAVAASNKDGMEWN